ncbi:MAG: inositol monophosphatase family protein, partial [Planctomycetota bacterium]|nr:inositol monophosphatase family protein [Planctomycetota bacterium]
MTLNQQSILEVATNAAQRGGDVLMRYLRDGVEMSDKTASGGKSYDLVSDADLESEKVIGSLIQQSYPDHELLGEEELDGSVDAEHLWIIDPLDGTNNYAHGIPHFAVSIAYYHCGVPQVGVVFNPARGDLYTAT